MAVPGKVIVYPDAQEFFILGFFYTVYIQVKIHLLALFRLIHMLQFLSCGNGELFCLLCVRDHLIWREPSAGIV